MIPKKIELHLMVGRDQAVCIDVSLLPDHPVVVRSVIIRQEAWWTFSSGGGRTIRMLDR
ncbi:hypothetical protein SAMN00790413_05942 [Deinococcus hopiensis KR-140]|uniref:Uncharacterized protein n=1 Tax=Deinococcus hopiensis KR-140 TaxID=695939 RepID=A0A1W1VVZ2_9DEIO|nr:hypothetical protein SAMN00790413_05942 [Deinococcus hopiensis KR-140]